MKESTDAITARDARGGAIKRKNSFSPIIDSRAKVEKIQEKESSDGSEQLEKLINERKEHIKLVELYLKKQKRDLKRDELLFEHKDRPNEQQALQNFFDHKKDYREDFQEFKGSFEQSLQEANEKFDHLDDSHIKASDQFYTYVLSHFNEISEIGDGMKEGESSRDSYVRLKSTYEEYKEYMKFYSSKLIELGETIKKRPDYYVLNKWNESEREEDFGKYYQQLRSTVDSAQQELAAFCSKYVNDNNPDDFDIAKLVNRLLATGTTKESIWKERKQFVQVVSDAATQVNIDKRSTYGRHIMKVLDDLEKFYEE